MDPAQLRQALDNLVRNAVEATPEGGRVSLAARRESGGHAIEVRDTGRGIEPDDVPRIFDLYFTTKAEGTGVGLAVTQQIVAAHGDDRGGLAARGGHDHDRARARRRGRGGRAWLSGSSWWWTTRSRSGACSPAFSARRLRGGGGGRRGGRAAASRRARWTSSSPTCACRDDAAWSSWTRRAVCIPRSP